MAKKKHKKASKPAKGKEEPLITQKTEVKVTKVSDNQIEKRAELFVNQSESFWAVVSTSFWYVVNDLRKKKRQFAIGISTIFLTVSVVTFLHSLIGLAPAVTMIASQSTVGDFDIQLTKRSEKDVRIQGNRNINFDDESFFDSKLNTSVSFYDRFIKTLSKRDMLPLVNYTQLNQTMTDIETHGFKGKKSKV